ncbi:regulatory protein RepA [Bathymodiolus japonicus methanotrophic gill symbiont]|uniref:AAA family ATPase n=2 Tax=Bathymodiolus japonicus methanotrophic gill symbiont TaxID=113269 RepID=UPI001B56D4BD|nr:AAA family ATPase [Bathymodiolus japonicus methanotrophic gill symbiont]GFO73478.1 regulatory protein RepA [Bathymodiolus japonicus methanotrophic gill symbiont]
MNDIEKTEEIKGKSKIESIPLDLISMSDTLPPDIEYVFPALPVGTVGIISAGGGVGKSFWMNQAVLQVAVGGSCDFGLGGAAKVKGGAGAVIYFNLEDPVEIIHQRFFNIANSYRKNIREKGIQNVDGEKIHKEWDFDEEWVNDALSGVTFHALHGKQATFLNDKGEQTVDGDWVIEECKKVRGVKLIVFDTLRRCHSGNENDTGVMSQVLKWFEFIASITGAAVILIHHENKLGLNDSDAGISAIRGASSIGDNARWAARMRRMGKEEAEERGIDTETNKYKKYINMGLPKINYGDDAEDAWLLKDENGVMFKTELPPIINKKEGNKIKYDRNNGRL